MKKFVPFDLMKNLADFFNLQPYEEIIPWIEENVSMTDDVSSESNHVDFERYPYQIEPLKHWGDMDCRKRMVIVACEQMGKSSMWIYGLLYRMVYDPGQSLICYPSDSKAIETNLQKLQPLMRHIPRTQRRAD